jgi:hypothetical protein
VVFEPDASSAGANKTNAGQKVLSSSKSFSEGERLKSFERP